MTKALFRRVLLFLAACVLLYSCRIEDDLIAEKNGENKARKFRALTSKDGEPVNYSHGFKYLLERYDRLHGTEFTRKAVLKKNKFAKNSMPEFIEFNIHSQDLIRNNGTERWIMYPVIKKGEVNGIAIAILKEEETNLQFWRLNEKDPYYKEVIGLFRMQYNKGIMKQGLSNRKPCGTEGEEPCEIPEVIINVPGNGPKGTPLMYLPGSGTGGGGYCETYGNCYGDGGNDDGGIGGSGGGDPTPTDSTNTPCAKTKAMVNNSKLKSKIESLKNFSLTAEDDEMGYQQDKSGEVKPAAVNGKHHVDFVVDQNSLGGIHSHTLNGTHMFTPRDILTFLKFSRVQNYTLPVGSTADHTGNAFLGMISQSGSYFITFNGSSGDLPPQMTEAEEDALEIELNKEYRNIIRKLLKGEGKNMGDDLSATGLQKLFFEIVKKMDLEGKINLIKQDGSNTSTIQQNQDGTIKEPIPC